MKKSLIVFTIGATVLTPMLTLAAEVKIYGRAHVSLDYLDDGKDYNETGLSSNASRLGFKVEQKINDDFNVFAQIEQEISFASGDQDSKSVNFSSRDTFVGIKNEKYGQLRAGRFDSPFKIARGPVNQFGDMVGDMRNVTRVGDLKFDERNENTLEYKSPKFADGLNVLAAISMNSGKENSKNPDGSSQKESKAYDLALTYKKDRIDFAAAYQKFGKNSANTKAPTAETNSGRNAFRIAGAYKITDDLNLGALYQKAQFEDSARNLDAQVWGVAGEYKFTPKTQLRAEYFYRDVDKDDANTSLIALGVEHKIDPDLRVYGNVATTLNDSNANLTPWKDGRSLGNGVVGSLGQDALALSLGMRYDF